MHEACSVVVDSLLMTLLYELSAMKWEYAVRRFAVEHSIVREEETDTFPFRPYNARLCKLKYRSGPMKLDSVVRSASRLSLEAVSERWQLAPGRDPAPRCHVDQAAPHVHSATYAALRCPPPPPTHTSARRESRRQPSKLPLAQNNLAALLAHRVRLNYEDRSPT